MGDLASRQPGLELQRRIVLGLAQEGDELSLYVDWRARSHLLEVFRVP